MNSNDRLRGNDLAAAVTELFEGEKVDLATTTKELAEYVAERISHLRFAANEPGYDEALVAERDAITLKAAGRAVDNADEFDGKLVALVSKAIGLGIAAL